MSHRHNNFQIFLSHAQADIDAAQSLKNWIGQFFHIEVFASSIAPGEDFRGKIAEAIKKCDLAIVLMSENSIHRDWVHFEAGGLKALNKYLIPVCIGNVKKGKLPSTLSDIQGCQFSDPSDTKQLILTIAERLNMPHALFFERIQDVNRAPNLCAGAVLGDIEKDDSSLALFKKCGIANVFRIPVKNHERGIRIEELIANELKRDCPEFRLSASSGFNYLHPHGRVWQSGLGESLLNNKAKISVVLQSPFSAFAITRALANEVTSNQWEDRGLPAQLKKLQKYDNISLRATGHPINCSLFFTTEAVFYDPYLWARPNNAARNENNFFVIEFSKMGLPHYCAYDLLQKHFDFLLHYSLPISSIIGDAEDMDAYRALEAKFFNKLKSLKDINSYDCAINF